MSVIIPATRNWRGGRVYQQLPKPGKRVHHDIFGAGTVVPYEKPKGSRSKKVYCCVNFDVHGRKDMLWSFCQGKIRVLVAVKPKEERLDGYVDSDDCGQTIKGTTKRMAVFKDRTGTMHLRGDATPDEIERTFG